MSGLVVVPRKWEPILNGNGKRRKVNGWTLHRADCFYIKRSTKHFPAPDDPYPHTTPCIYCKPTGEAGRQINRPRAAALPKSYRKPPGHLNKYVERDGGWVASCVACDIEKWAPRYEAAKIAAYRAHMRRDGQRGY